MFKKVQDDKFVKVWQTKEIHGFYGEIVDYKIHFDGKVHAIIWNKPNYAPYAFGDISRWFSTVHDAKAYVRAIMEGV